MKIRITGEMSTSEIGQAVLEQLNELEIEHAIRYSRGATLYINPTNGFGSEIYVLSQSGKKIEEMSCTGPYKSAADEYEP